MKCFAFIRYLHFILLGLTTLTSVSTAYGAQALLPTKEKSLEKMKELIEMNQSQLKELDRDLDHLLENEWSRVNTASLTAEAERLRVRRRNLLNRQKLLHRLEFYVDTKYNGKQPWHHFLQSSLKDIAKKEMKTPEAIDESFWKLTLSWARQIKIRVTPFSEPLDALESLVRHLNPVENSPARPDYNNGRDQHHAKGTPRDQIGEIVERRTQASLTSKNRFKRLPAPQIKSTKVKAPETTQ